MLSVSVADQVRFKTKKGSTVTALPVTVEFGKFVRGDKTSRLANVAEWSRLALGGFDSEQVASPSDLLHAVVALYNSCLPDITIQVLYRTVCFEGARTLFLLRDTAEVLKEWENQVVSSSSCRSREDSVGEINNNPVTGQDNRKSANLSSSNSTHEQERTTIPVPKPHSTSDDGDCSSNAVSPIQDEWRPWTPKNRRSEEGTPERSVFMNKNSLNTALLGDNCKTDGYSHNESPFSDIFSDSVEDSESESDMEEEDDHEDFSRGLETFLKSVALRKETRITQERYCLLPSHVGIEHKLIASATFHKNYKIPGIKVVNLSLLTVRKRYRKCGVGRYFLKRLKSPSQVGPYDALVVQADNNSLGFFRKNGFADDVILCSRFRDVEERRENTTVLCYLPPFDGHYPPLPGVHDWDRPESLAAMQDEIERWKQKSLESYQAQFTCLTRLQQEVYRLHNLLRRQDATIVFLKRENQKLQSRLSKVQYQFSRLNPDILQMFLEKFERKSAQSLIEALEKEAADFERLCTLKLENLETT